MSNEFQEYLTLNGILFRSSNRDEPRQNGISERRGSIVMDAAMSMLKHAKTRNSGWAYAVKNAETVINMLPTKTVNGRSPDEMDSGIKSNVSRIRTFGCQALVRIPSTSRRKGDDKAELCTFLYYRDGVKPGWTFRSERTNRLITSGDAIFYEGDWLPNGIQTLDALFKDRLDELDESDDEIIPFYVNDEIF